MNLLYPLQRLTGDAATQQALKDQKATRWPGCERGYMNCTDSCCACDERTPCASFVTKRAAQLRKEGLK